MIERSESHFSPATFHDLVKLSLLSLEMRVIERVATVSPPDPRGIFEARLALIDSDIRSTMHRWGRQYRTSGEDLRGSRFWDVLAHQKEYVSQFEAGRPVCVDDLTPMAIYSALKNDNVLTWRGWHVTAGTREEKTDDFGQPCWGRSIDIDDPKGRRTSIDIISRDNARRAYRVMTGTSFEGIDTLGFDPPHPAENIPPSMEEMKREGKMSKADIEAEDAAVEVFMEALNPITRGLLQQFQTAGEALPMIWPGIDGGPDCVSVSGVQPGRWEDQYWHLSIEPIPKEITPGIEHRGAWRVREHGAYAKDRSRRGRFFVGAAAGAVAFGLDLMTEAANTCQQQAQKENL